MDGKYAATHTASVACATAVLPHPHSPDFSYQQCLDLASGSPWLRPWLDDE